MHRHRFVAAIAALVTTSSLLADFVSVDLSASINSDLRTYTGGASYPTGAQTLEFGGVPFALGSLAGDPNSLGAVQLPGNSQLTTHSFAVNVTGATRLYTLINSAWGAMGVTNGTVEVFGTNGAYVSVSLVQGVNIRDHYNRGYQNVVTDPTIFSTNYSSGVRLDRQVIELPATFDGQVVTEIRFSGVGANPTGAAFLAGATLETGATCAADFDHDNMVGPSDLAILLGAWGTPAADLDGDGTTTASDLALVLGAWGACP